MNTFALTGLDCAIGGIFLIGLVKGFFHGQGWLNRLFGVLFGGIKAAAILMVLVVLLGFLDSHFHFLSEEMVQASYLYSLMLQLAYLTWDAILSLFGK